MNRSTLVDMGAQKNLFGNFYFLHPEVVKSGCKKARMGPGRQQAAWKIFRARFTPLYPVLSPTPLCLPFPYLPITAGHTRASQGMKTSYSWAADKG